MMFPDLCLLKCLCIKPESKGEKRKMISGQQAGVVCVWRGGNKKNEI